MATPTPTTSIIPPLSRAFKSQPYLRNQTKKRKLSKDTTASPSFEIGPSTNGVGMFATERISCGDLIIANEEPIVQWHPSCLNVCDVCAAPLGSLRDQHLMAPADLVLPYLEDRLVFTTSDTACDRCDDVAWCDDCKAKRSNPHDFVCHSSPTKEFYEAQENPTIFQLATRSITLILSQIEKRENEDQTQIEKREIVAIQKFHWWKDYGSHPLWWEVGASRDTDKLEQAETFCNVLQEALKSSRQRVRLEMIDDLCTLENIGQILGMLQCNVMEYEITSPTCQYMEHVEEILEQGMAEPCLEDTRDWDAEDDEIRAFKAGCNWLAKNIGQHKANTAPIVGSGLYPLLTLANHDCDPNASIEFLQESNRGSMVATRDISVGEEICITYVPNGGVGGGDGSAYFRHFKPTRTWKWLNAKDEEDGNEDGGAAAQHDRDDFVDDRVDDDSASIDDKSGAEEREEEADEDNEQPLEGSDQKERASALLEYGFDCQCQRCQGESSCSSIPSGQ